MALLKVLDAGAGVTIQDHGRSGYQRYGIAEGGVMDRWALSEGNLLLQNEANTAAIEMIAIGGKFAVTDFPIMMSTSGAEMNLTLDGAPLPWRSSFVVQPGQVLQCGYAHEAIYSYLHVYGGFAISPVMQSFSTLARSSLSGFAGRSLRAGDELPLAIKSGQGLNTVSQKLPLPEYLNTSRIRIVWGSQAHVFSELVRDALLQNEFCVSAQRDRMGARLSTNAGSLAAGTGLSGVSGAVVIGDVQVAGDGVATVLLADRQPTGGYPRIATVITADLDAMSQMPTNRAFRFELVSLEEAVAALHRRRQALDALSGQITNVLRQAEEMQDLLSYNLIDGVVDATDRPES